MAHILITGGTGLVGQHIASLLQMHQHTFSILTRNPKRENEYQWNVKNGTIDNKAFTNVDYIIHLAGAGIADKRWTDSRKKEIIDSRVLSTNLLYQNIQALQIPLKGFICASATGYYGGVTTGTIFTETDTPGSDFLGKVCQQWEASAMQFEKAGIPTTILRTGIVLSKKGGALEKMKTPIISPLGSGKQYVPWIHIEDLCELYVKAIEDNDFTGIYNAVAPEHQTSYSFSKALAKVYKRPFLPFGVPSFMLKLIFGEMAIILLKGSRVSSEKLQEKKYIFTYPDLQKALQGFI